MPHPFFFLASLAWNFGLGMTWLPVPLYAHAQGLSNAEIGALFAVPVLAQAPLNQGFYVLGALAIVCALVIARMRAWAFSRPKQP